VTAERAQQTAERAQQTAERAQRTAERAQRVADIGEHNFQISRALGLTIAPVAMLDSLKPITLAAWNATGIDDAHNLSISTCTPGTRVSLLEDLMTWATALDSSCVFWLNGLAGTGKSTIARTLCERLDQQGLLGASFFISRDQSERRDASNIVRSIAHQLAVRWRPVSDALCTELCESPTSKARSLREQITDFIIIPARALPATKSFILVIDALDEALSDLLGRPGGNLLLLLVPQLLQLAGRVKLLITSRNEVPIQQMFRELSATPQTVNTVKLHELDKVIVQDDIAIYLNHSFTVIRNTRLDLELTGWPSPTAVSILVELSGLLFIYAATAVRFVTHRKHSPRERLDRLLGLTSNTSKSAYSQLDRLYRQILNDAVHDPDGDETDEAALCQRVQVVMAMIVLAHTPLNINAIGTLSGMGLDGCRIMVGHLASLLADSGGGVRAFHPSFPDFAIDAARCTDSRLCVVPAVGHGYIALRCLELMNRHLRYDICDIQYPTLANDDIEDLDVILRENVSDALRYAACFWCNHLAASGAPDGALMNALNTFCQKHLFHWVEILSLVQHVVLAEPALLGAIEWCIVRDFVAQCEQGESDTAACRNTLRTPHPMSQNCYRIWRGHCGSSRFPSVLTRCTHITAHL
jgi:hypothetical protein